MPVAFRHLACPAIKAESSYIRIKLSGYQSLRFTMANSEVYDDPYKLPTLFTTQRGPVKPTVKPGWLQSHESPKNQVPGTRC